MAARVKEHAHELVNGKRQYGSIQPCGTVLPGYRPAVKYQETHPWLRFSLNVSPSDHRLWLRLGAVASKCEHLSGVPLKPGFAQELNRVFLAKGALATTAIEGNTLSEEQVRQQVEGKLVVPPSQEYLKQEVENIINVCNEEVQARITPGAGEELGPELIRSYNRRILHNLELEPGVVAGELRTHPVIVGDVYRGAPPGDCGYLLGRLCDWLNGPDFVAPEEDLKIPYALLRAIVAHVYLAWIHPFGDGNGRTARLVEFHILFSSGVPLPAAHLLSDHYNRTRTKYYRELDGASRSGGDLMPFIRYAVQGFLDGIRQQIAGVHEHQMAVAWENHVHERFKDKKSSPAQRRRRDVVLELSDHGWVQVSRIEELSVRLAHAYRGAGGRMLQRDLNAIARMGLLDRVHGRVRARKYIMQAFLPARVMAAQEQSGK